MIFLNWIMVLGLAAVAIPIIIHLLNRRRAKVQEWGAMRFLRASLAAQSRRLLLEEIMLLALRCLAVALIVLAMARPFMPSKSSIPWAFVLPALLAGAICAGIAAAVWTRARLRRNLLRAAGTLLLAALLVSVLERWLQLRRWSGAGGAKDVMIVLDASPSMRVMSDGKSNFARAVEEAQALINGCHPGDAVGVLLAGSVPRALVRTPTADHRAVQQALRSRECRPLGGAMGVLEALNAASAALAEGQNPAKGIVLITDGQSAGWDLASEARWRFLLDGFHRLSSAPEIICRTLPFPREFRNAALTDLTLSRRVIGTDRPVKIDARVVNAGTVPVKLSAIDLQVDGSNVCRQVLLKELPPGVAESFRFEFRFDAPGFHTIATSVVCDDDLPADNTAYRVVDVLANLPVLLVDGAPSERFFQGAAAFTRLALTPRSDTPPAHAADGAAPRFLIEPTVVAATALAAQKDLARYRVIVLANVAQLPASVTERIDQFVRNGGGLLILPGNRSEPQFYSRWRTASGDPFAPALMYARRASLDEPARLELHSLTHPALQLIADPRVSDAGLALVRSFWKLTADPRDPAVRIGGQLHTGEPFMAERQVGKGYVLMTSIAFDHRDSNIPSLKSFVPLVHELVYYLAAPLTAELNLAPGEEASLELTAERPDLKINREAATRLVQSRARGLEVLTPAGDRRPARVTSIQDRLVARFSETYEPGLYWLALPREVVTPTSTNGAGRLPFLALPPPLEQQAAPLTGSEEAILREVAAQPSASAETWIPFTVLPPAQENAMTFLTDSEEAVLRGRMKFFTARSTQDMVTAISGEVPGEEFWKVLAAGALLALLGEVALSRWIALQRRFHAAETVAFRSPSENAADLQGRARMWAASSPAAGAAPQAN